MEELWRIRGAVIDTDELADQATYQRLLRGFRAEEANDHQRRLLYGEDSPGSDQQEIPRGD